MLSGNKVKPRWARELSESEYTHWDLAGTLPRAAAQERCVRCLRDCGWEKMLGKDALTTTEFAIPPRGCLPSRPSRFSSSSLPHEKRAGVSEDEMPHLISDWVLWACPSGWLQPLILGATVLYLWRFSFHGRHLDCSGLWWFKVQCEWLADSSLFSIILWLGQENQSVLIMLPHGGQGALGFALCVWWCVFALCFKGRFYFCFFFGLPFSASCIYTSICVPLSRDGILYG